MSGKKRNPGLYRKLSEPIENEIVFDRALGMFFDELGELREKWGLRDVHVIVEATVHVPNESGGDPDEGIVMSSMHFGDASRAEAMAAYSYGREVKVRQQTMSLVLSGARMERKNRE